jgi:hypothetical protein
MKWAGRNFSLSLRRIVFARMQVHYLRTSEHACEWVHSLVTLSSLIYVVRAACLRFSLSLSSAYCTVAFFLIDRNELTMPKKLFFLILFFYVSRCHGDCLKVMARLPRWLWWLIDIRSSYSLCRWFACMLLSYMSVFCFFQWI